MQQVYFAQCGDRIKIGISRRVQERLAQLRTGAGAPVTLLASIEGDGRTEKALHKKLKQHHLDGEWFRDHPDVRAAIQNSLNNFPIIRVQPKKKRRTNEKFAAVCRVIWPIKPAEHMAAIAGLDARTARRWLSGEYEPPAIILAAILTELTRRD